MHAEVLEGWKQAVCRKQAEYGFGEYPVGPSFPWSFRKYQGKPQKHQVNPEGPRIEKIQSREAILKKSSFQYGMKILIENENFIPGPSLTAEKQGPGLKFSIENEIFKPRMKISSENENFVRGGMDFSSSSNAADRGPLRSTVR